MQIRFFDWKFGIDDVNITKRTKLMLQRHKSEIATKPVFSVYEKIAAKCNTTRKKKIRKMSRQERSNCDRGSRAKNGITTSMEIKDKRKNGFDRDSRPNHWTYTDERYLIGSALMCRSVNLIKKFTLSTITQVIWRKWWSKGTKAKSRPKRFFSGYEKIAGKCNTTRKKKEIKNVLTRKVQLWQGIPGEEREYYH